MLVWPWQWILAIRAWRIVGGLRRPILHLHHVEALDVEDLDHRLEHRLEQLEDLLEQPLEHLVQRLEDQ